MQTQIVWRLSHSISLNQVYIFRFVGPWNSERSSLSPAIILLDTAYILKLMHHYDDGVGDPLVLNREIKINCSTPRTPRLYLGLATLFVGAFLHSKLSLCAYRSNRQFCHGSRSCLVRRKKELSPLYDDKADNNCFKMSHTNCAPSY